MGLAVIVLIYSLFPGTMLKVSGVRKVVPSLIKDRAQYLEYALRFPPLVNKFLISNYKLF